MTRWRRLCAEHELLIARMERPNLLKKRRRRMAAKADRSARARYHPPSVAPSRLRHTARTVTPADDRYPDYVDQILAYVDILGWKDRIHESQANRQVLRPALRALEIMLRWKHMSTSVRKRLGTKRAREPAVVQQISQFSDLIAISCQPTQEALLHLLYVLQQFSNRLLIGGGLYTRGAVVRGDLIHTDSIILGPALVDAYELEQSPPGHPRIQISSSAIALIGAPQYPYEGDGFAAPILKDTDGVFFLDTLQEARDTVTFYARWLRQTMIEQMKHDYDRFKGRKRRSIMGKHEWMMAYVKSAAKRFSGRKPTEGYWARTNRWP